MDLCATQPSPNRCLCATLHKFNLSEPHSIMLQQQRQLPQPSAHCASQIGSKSAPTYLVRGSRACRTARRGRRWEEPIIAVHACTHARPHPRAHARMHAHTHACTHARTHARMHAHTHARVHTDAFTHARTLARTHARSHARTHAACTHFWNHTLALLLPLQGACCAGRSLA